LISAGGLWLGRDGIIEFGLAREFMLPLNTGTFDAFVGIAAAMTELQAGELACFRSLSTGAEPWRDNILRPSSTLTANRSLPMRRNWLGMQPIKSVIPCMPPCYGLPRERGTLTVRGTSPVTWHQPLAYLQPERQRTHSVAQ